MKTLEVRGKLNTSRVLLGASMSNLGKYCDLKKTVIISDRNVLSNCGKRLPKCKTIEIGTGEGSKTLKTVEEIYKGLLEIGVDRSYFILGVGGGIVCDIAGFAASTYLRGLKFGFVPTSLLAQADASIGGKNGVNFMGFKNLVGTINQPEFVLCDFSLLTSLPEAEIRNGYAEVIKVAAIADSSLLDYLEQNVEKALALDKGFLEEAIYRSGTIKAKIVSEDETENGARRMLNFGHTIGHAIEKTYKLRHGEAVSVGMVAAARISQSKGMLGKAEVDKLAHVLAIFGLPVSKTMDPKLIMNAITKDKKRTGGAINFVFLSGLGNGVSTQISISELEGAVNDMCMHS